MIAGWPVRLKHTVNGEKWKTRRQYSWTSSIVMSVPHQTQPTIGYTANLHLVASLPHMTKPCEWNDTTPRQHSVFENPPKPADRLFHLPTGPGLGLQINEAELAKRRGPIAVLSCPRE